MKWWILFITVAFAGQGFAQEIEIVPCKQNSLFEKPTCCLKRIDTDLILYKGVQEVKRFQISAGFNIVERDHVNDATLLIALQTLNALRAANACN